MGDVNPLRRLTAVRGRAPADLASIFADVSRGDQAAFSELYDLTSDLVHGIARRIVRDPAMAEEVTQDVFLELWRLAPRYDASKGSVRTWVATLAHRRAVDRVRSEQAGRRRDEQELRRQTADYDHVSEEVLDRLDHTRVQRALAALSDLQRDAVSLAYYGGYTYREVAVLLDVPEGTIKTRIRDGLIKLRDDFGVSP